MAMLTRLTPWLKVLPIALVAVAMLGTGEIAGAQGAAGATNAQTNLSSEAKAWLVGGLLALAVVTVAMHYYFLSKSRQEYFRAAAALFQQGVFPQPTLVKAQGDSPTGVLTTARLTENDGETINTLKVVGPASLLSGQQAIYVALLNEALAAQAVWTVDPADAATVTPGMGGITVISPTGEGQFSLMAALPEQGLTTPPQTISVLPEVKPVPESSPPTLPFIGQGFASLVGAIVLIAAVVVLAAIGVQDWEVIGTIFGALAGYLFGMTTWHGDQ